MDTSVGNIILNSCCWSHYMLVLKVLEAFQLVRAIFGLLRSLSCLRWSSCRSIRELRGDTELAFEDSVPRMNRHVPFAAAMVCGCARSSGRDIVVVVATMARNFDSGALVVLVVTVVGAEVSCDTRFTVATCFASSVFIGCHVVWSWS